VAEPPAEQMF